MSLRLVSRGTKGHLLILVVPMEKAARVHAYSPGTGALLMAVHAGGNSPSWQGETLR